jgi:hypothetical protein
MVSLKSIIHLSFVVLAYAVPVSAQQVPARPPSQPSAAGQAPVPVVPEPVDDAFVPTVESKTGALEVVSVARRESFLRMRIRNVSDKKIYSFRMSYHKNGTSLLFSLCTSDIRTPLAPGEVYEYEHSYIPKSSLAREPLTFEAVLFEDGTGDGVADKVKSLQDLYLANRKELEHVIALFQSETSSPGIETIDGLQGLLSKVSETPDYMYGVAHSGLSGITLTMWKATAMHMIRDIAEKKAKDEGVNIQDELIKVLEGFNKTLSKYPGTN